MTRRMIIRFISVCMTLVVTFSLTAFPVSAERNFEKEIEDLQNQIDGNNSKVDSSKDYIDKCNEEIKTMQKQLNVYNEKLAGLNLQINDKDLLILENENQIKTLSAEIDKKIKSTEEQLAKIKQTYDKLSQRLNAIYVSNEASSLEVLLTCEDFESFLTRMEIINNIAKHDKELVSGLEAEIAELDKVKEQLEADKAVVEQTKAKVESDRAVIASARSEVQSVYNVLNKKQSEIESNVQKQNNYIANLDKSTDKYTKLMDEVRRAEEEYHNSTKDEGSSGSGEIGSGDGSHGFKVSSKGMISPLQGKVIVSSPYGNRILNGYKDFHIGIDLCISGGTAGKPIYAAASGTVLRAEYNSSYGYTILIDHGDGVKTRYAHATKDSFRVSKGDKVSQGQIIAAAGNTGNSFGAHLHFEVIINGNTVNPAGYIPL